MRQESKRRLHNFYPFLGAILFVLIIELLRQTAIRVPHLVETWYSKGFAIFPSAMLGKLSALAAFSLAEPLVLGHVILLVLLFLSSVWHLLRRNVKLMLEGLRHGLTYLLILYCLFMLLWGFHYLRPSLAERIELPIQPRAVEELATLAETIILQANNQRAQMHQEGAPLQQNSPQNKRNSETFERLAPAMTSLLEDYANTPIGQQIGLLQGIYSPPKAVVLSEGMSYMGITGIYMPFTGEANVNTHAPVTLLAATMLHELAHQRGIAPEDEANFVAYLASQSSRAADVKYSGSLLALIHTMNALQQKAPETARALRALYSEGLLSDLRSISTYWQRYEGEASRVQERVNDAYLKHNQQASGIDSYGQMVDLLLAYSAQGKK